MTSKIVSLIKETARQKNLGPTSFEDLILEAKKAKEKIPASKNGRLATHYEISVALKLHDRAKKAAKDKKMKFDDNDEHISSLRNQHKELEKHLSKNDLEENERRSETAANSYVRSLRENHGIELHHISHVYHTGEKGIGQHIGEPMSVSEKKMNPHDVLIKTRKDYTHKGKKYRFHGTSLKRGSATESNMGLSEFSKMHDTEKEPKNKIGHKIQDIWTKAREKAGWAKGKFADKKARKKWQADKNTISVYKTAQKEAVKHHLESFNSADTETQRKHLHNLLKGEPRIPYDRTSSVTGVSHPHDDSVHRRLVRNCVSFHARKTEKGESSVHFYGIDKHGNEHHIAYAEHRHTHGPFHGMQVNTKIREKKE